MRYLHTMVRVTNLESALNFYCNILGFIEVRRRDCEIGKFTLVYLMASGDYKSVKTHDTPILELTFNWESEDYTGGRNFGHIAYEVDNIYETCKDLMGHGITLCRPPRDGYMAFIQSPDGISIELLQKGNRLGQAEPWISMPNQGSW